MLRVRLRGERAEAKRAARKAGARPDVTKTADYDLPSGVVGLTGPIDKPAPGTLPIRGDLAHIALAHRYLAAHYVIPQLRTVAEGGATFLLQMRDNADPGVALDAGIEIEVLDVAGDWIWACCGPEGPSGYLRSASLAA